MPTPCNFKWHSLKNLSRRAVLRVWLYNDMEIWGNIPKNILLWSGLVQHSYDENEICISLTDLTHWGQVTHICVSKLTVIGSDNGLSPCRRQAIIWTSARIFSIAPLGTNCSKILIEIRISSSKKTHLKASFAKCQRCCLSLNMLNNPKSMGIHLH